MPFSDSLLSNSRKEIFAKISWAHWSKKNWIKWAKSQVSGYFKVNFFVTFWLIITIASMRHILQFLFTFYSCFQIQVSKRVSRCMSVQRCWDWTILGHPSRFLGLSTLLSGKHLSISSCSELKTQIFIRKGSIKKFFLIYLSSR